MKALLCRGAESTTAMHLAVDDTDSRDGMCTTYLLAKMITEMPFDLIGLPRLVRLNPAVPWKTRGNGALAMRLGVGGGEPQRIGSAAEDVMCYPRLRREVSADEVMEWALPYVREHMQAGSNPGIVVSRTKPPQRLYWQGARDILSIDEVTRTLDGMGALRHGEGDGRGIVGASCAMAWRPRDRSLELLAYRQEERWGSIRHLDVSTVERLDALYPSTFNNIERRWMKAAIMPSTPCPVLYGIRGEDLPDLLSAKEMLETEDPGIWMVFLSNQGSDDHVIEDPAELLPNRSYRLGLSVSSPSRDEKGGHVIIRARRGSEELECAAYEPSKEFRNLLRLLRPGDAIDAIGELREEPRTLNLEKVLVKSLADSQVKAANPRCPRCGRAAKSVGKGAGYRCRPCSVHLPEGAAPALREQRLLVPGWYEPPVCSRRHLSKPLCRMGEEQPLDFV